MKNTIKTMLLFGGTIFVSLAGGYSYAEQQHAEHQQEKAEAHEKHGHAIESRHHVSMFLGGTTLLVPDESDETAFTLGIDYEYRVSPLIGLGFVAERAFGDIEANTLIAAVDIHIYEGWVVQTGLGFERIDSETNRLVRLGVLYEFEFGEYTISPQVHYDATNREDSVVFGFAFGRNF